MTADKFFMILILLMELAILITGTVFFFANIKTEDFSIEHTKELDDMKEQKMIETIENKMSAGKKLSDTQLRFAVEHYLVDIFKIKKTKYKLVEILGELYIIKTHICGHEQPRKPSQIEMEYIKIFILEGNNFESC